jgi:hypothetical protein
VKADLRREIAAYFARRGTFTLLEVPPLQHLAVDGRGDPNTSTAYGDALAALYPLAYGLKFLSRDLGRDHTVMPLEALWWSDDLAAFTSARDKSRWEWTVMIMVPDWITAEHVATARTTLVRRSPARASAVRLVRLEEGLSVLPAHGLRMRGKHHEIYLNDARRTAPARLRTILRQPVEPVPAGRRPDLGPLLPSPH